MKYLFTIIGVVLFFLLGAFAMANIMCAGFPTLYPANVCPQ